MGLAIVLCVYERSVTLVKRTFRKKNQITIPRPLVRYTICITLLVVVAVVLFVCFLVTKNIYIYCKILNSPFGRFANT